MKQLNPKVFWLFFVHSLIGWFFALLFIGGFFSIFLIGILSSMEVDLKGRLSWLWVAIPLFLLAFIVFLFFWAKLTYRSYRYQLTDVAFYKEYGVIFKKQVTIPFDRIQNVDIYRGILDRILGLSELNILTAGSSIIASKKGSEGCLPGLSQEIARKISEDLIRRSRQSKDQGI